MLCSGPHLGHLFVRLPQLCEHRHCNHLPPFIFVTKPFTAFSLASIRKREDGFRSLGLMGELLLKARGHDAGPGSVSELHLKHLLALNLRKLQGAEHAFAPRSYVLQRGSLEEFRRFALDFKMSKALALVRRVALERFADERPQLEAALKEPEGLWGRQLPNIAWETCGGTTEVSEDCLDAAVSLLSKALGGEGIEEEWRRLCDCDCRGPIAFRDAKECQRLSSLADLHIEFQIPLLCWNFWALKPSCGQFGRGILLIDRLPRDPEALLDWAAAVGRGGLKGNNDVKEGCVLQKLVEEPHLLDKELLERGIGTPLRPLFKYNLRMIVLATLRSPCRIWLYHEGFVSLALSPFSSQLDPLSHITNLRQGSGYESQRRWPIRDLDTYLQSAWGSSFDESIRPQVKRIVSSLFHALALDPTSLQPVEAGSGRSAVGKKLRRFGLDFLVDASRNVWLLEVNFLKNGYALGHAQAGSAGDTKRDFVQDFLAQEALLRMATAVEARGPERPASFEELLPELCFTSPEQGHALQLACCVQLFWAPTV